MARHRAMHATEPSPIRTAPLALWRVAAAFLQVLHALFGGPEHVAARHTLTGKAHAQLAAWLRCGEAMLRRLLLIEAAAYPRPNTRPLLRAAQKRVRKLMHFTAEATADWRVSFRCFHLPPHRGGSVERSETKGEVAPSVAFGSSSPAGGGDKIRAFVLHDEPPAPRPSRPQARGTYVRHPPMLRQDRPWVHAKTPLAFRSAWPLAERYEALLRVFNAPAAYAQRLARRLHATPHRLHEALRAPAEARHRVDDFEALGEEARSRWRPFFSSA
ncbi:MAG: hypothetical protein R3C30_17365 [Hyphomonadaceae bacterium]